MSFETLILEPVAGSVDVAAVREWLNTAPFADLMEPDTWQLCATPRLAVLARLDRELDVTHPRPGVVVWVDRDRVGMTAYADEGAMARTRDFVRWLCHMGGWTAKVDRAPPVLLSQVDDIFDDDLPAVDTLLDDLTVEPVVMGTRTSWGGRGYQLHMHSSGQLRFEAPDRTLRAELDAATLARWNAAVEAVDVDDPELPDNPPEANALTVEIETPGHTAFAMLDSTIPPVSMTPLFSLAQEWMKALTAWTGEQHIAGLTRLRVEHV